MTLTVKVDLGVFNVHILTKLYCLVDKVLQYEEIVSGENKMTIFFFFSFLSPMKQKKRLSNNIMLVLQKVLQKDCLCLEHKTLHLFRL